MTEARRSPETVIAANASAYARIVDEWDRAWNDENEAMHAPSRELFRNSLAGTAVLDAGCGLGRDSVWFAVQGLSVTATDIVPGFLARIRVNRPSVSTAVMDMTRPCFRDAIFDGIYCFASFLHVPHELTHATLMGFCAMLRPGGILFMHHVVSRAGFDSYRVDDLLITGNPATCYCHSEHDLAALLARAGFRRVDIHHAVRPAKRSAVAKRYDLEPYQIVATV